jgi:hypothetical protein
MHKTIKPDIQEAILCLLPDEGDLALCIMAQLLANMILSIKDANAQAVVDLIWLNLNCYKEAERAQPL